MYTKKYHIEKIEEFNAHNPLYDEIGDNVCYLVYLNVGERGWFMYDTGNYYDRPHRIHTSTVTSVEYIDDIVIVATRNTRITFKLIKE